MSFFPPQCLWTTIYSNLLQNVRELHCLREIQITREVDLGFQKKIIRFLPVKKNDEEEEEERPEMVGVCYRSP
jgi:hypothetical protein